MPLTATDTELIQRRINDIETHLTGAFQTELGELRKLQALHTQEAKKVVKEGQEETLQRLQALQLEEAELVAKRQGLWNKLLAALVSLLTAVAAGGVYVGLRPQPVTEQEAKPVLEKVEAVNRETSAEIEARVSKAEAKIERLKDVALEQQVQLSESTDYIVRKIDAAHPRTADAVQVPPSVKQAKDKADAIKREREQRSEEMFPETDPFAGID